jgi:protein-disulfide isomerase
MSEQEKNVEPEQQKKVHHEINHSHKTMSVGKSSSKKTWQIISGILFLLLIASFFFGGNDGNVKGTISKEAASEKAIEFINTNMLQAGTTAQVKNIEEEKGLYKMTLDIGGREFDSYITKDGGVLFPSVVDLTETLRSGQTPETQSRDIKIDTENSASKGADDAKVLMIEYSSFSCSFCNKVRATIDQILTNYPDDVKLIYKHFNRGGTDSQTAQATECAGEQEKFWEMHDLIFDKGSRGDLVGYAQDIGIDVDKFSECLNSGKYSAKVTADTNEARSFGISGTPGFIINGKLVSGAQPFSVFQQVIETELAK